MTITSVPKTFGIKYGTLVLSLVLMSRVVCGLVAISIGHHVGPTGIVIIGLITTLIAQVIVHFFSEKLDIENLMKRKLVVFQDFGLTRGETLNFKRDNTVLLDEY